jgi:heat shock protein HspQ
MTFKSLSESSLDTGGINPPLIGSATFAPGDIVRHRMFDFRGVVFDIDPVFANSDEWYEAIPEGMRPSKEQPFYHLLAENEDSSYIAYVSQQNLVADGDRGPVEHPQIEAMFDGIERGRYRLRAIHRH